MTANIPSFLHGAVNDYINHQPETQEVKKALKETSEAIGTIAKYMIVAAVAFAALGLACAVSSGFSALIIPVAIAGCLAYAGYNLSQVESNLNSIIENPAEYIQIDASQILNQTSSEIISLNAEAIKFQMKQNTFAFDWAIDMAFDTISEELLAQKNAEAPAASA